MIKELNKEYNSNILLKNSHFDWFVSFVLLKKSEFAKLTEYRHPFIHYKVDNISGQFRGGLIAATLNRWNIHNMDEGKLKALEIENEGIKAFLVDQFNLCKTGYEHMLELIKLMPDK